MPEDEVVIEMLFKLREETLERHRKELAAIDRAIEKVREPGPSGDAKRPVIVPDMLKGLDTASALQVYLNLFSGGPVPIKQLVRDLLVAGVDLGQPDRNERNVKITIANNKQFTYTERADTVELTKERIRR